MTKRLLTLLLIITLLTGIANAQSFTYNGLIYKVIQNTSTVSVSSGESTSGSVVIPEIAHHIYYTYDSNGNAIKHDDAYTVIGIDRFDNCRGLTSITIPNSVTTIYSFYNCTGLTSVTIPNSVTFIGSLAFYGCSGLKIVNWNARKCAVSIEESSPFETLTNITTFNIGNEVEEIPSWLCKGLSGVTSVTIPNSVTSIGAGAFYGCSGLTGSLNIPNSVTSIGGGAFHGCSGLTSVNIPNSVTSIGNFAFKDCSGLTSITIPNSVTSIGGGAFYGCSGLETVNWNVKTCSDFANIAQRPFHSSTNILEFNIGNEVERIPAYLCTALSGLTSVTIPNSVTSIGYEAFHNCTGLTSVNISDLAAWCNIDFEYDANGYDSQPLLNAQHLFLNGNEVTDLVIPSTVTKIKNLAFGGCYGLTSVNIGNSVTEIGIGSFMGCGGLTDVTIGNSVTSIGEAAFAFCTDLKNVTIGNSVTSIGNSAFDAVNELTYVKDIYCYIQYPENVALGNGVFNKVEKEVCVLHVPTGTVSLYRSCEQWKDFLNIIDDLDERSTISGDVDGSAMVDVDDVNAMINLILNYDQYKDQYPGSADLDGNGMVDVDDVNALINMILAK